MEYQVLINTGLAIIIFIGLGVTFAKNPRRFEKQINKIFEKYLNK